MQALVESPIPIICPPIKDVYGVPIDHSPAAIEDPRDISELVADELGCKMTADTWGLDTGKKAEIVLNKTGCAECALAGLCQVKNILDERVAVGEFNRELAAVATKISISPDWLKRARASHVANNSLEEAVASGAERPSALLAGVENSGQYRVTAKEAPLLGHISSLRIQKEVTACDITTDTGKYQIIDISGANGHNGPLPSAADQSVLEYKMLQRLVAVDAQGLPLVFVGDGRMQKRVARVGNIGDACPYEIRMNNKNRLYILVEQLPSGNENGYVGRIVILGSHGGNEKDQQRFIDNVVR